MSIRNEAVDLKETDLNCRLMVLARSNRDIDLNYELTLTSRALFATNRSMLECYGKTDLIYKLEAITEVDDPRLSTRHDSQQRNPIALLNGRPETARTESDDPGPIYKYFATYKSNSFAIWCNTRNCKYFTTSSQKNCSGGRHVSCQNVKEIIKVNIVKDVSTLFNSQLINMTCSYDEIIFAFDTDQVH